LLKRNSDGQKIYGYLADDRRRRNASLDRVLSDSATTDVARLALARTRDDCVL
jgi:hypothetical protein